MPEAIITVLTNTLSGESPAMPARPAWLEFLYEITPDRGRQNFPYFVFKAFVVFYLARSLADDDSREVKQGLIWLLVIAIAASAVRALYMLW